MLRELQLAGALALLVACTTASDVQDEDPFAAAPDIAGTYDVVLQAGSGCGEDMLADWASPSLTIAGEASQLSFDFGAGHTLTGNIDQSFFVEFSGEVTRDTGVVVSVLADGVASQDAQHWRIDGTLRAKPSDNSCEWVADYAAVERAQ